MWDMEVLTSNGCGTAFDGEEDGEDGVGDGVVDHVAFPFDLDSTAWLAVDCDAVHDLESFAGA